MINTKKQWVRSDRQSWN